MEGLGVTRAAGIERCFTTSKLAELVLRILYFSLASSVPDERALEQMVLASAIRSGCYEGEPTASLRDGRPARRWSACLRAPRLGR